MNEPDIIMECIVSYAKGHYIQADRNQVVKDLKNVLSRVCALEVQYITDRDVMEMVLNAHFHCKSTAHDYTDMLLRAFKGDYKRPWQPLAPPQNSVTTEEVVESCLSSIRHVMIKDIPWYSTDRVMQRYPDMFFYDSNKNKVVIPK